MRTCEQVLTDILIRTVRFYDWSCHLTHFVILFIQMRFLRTRNGRF